MAGQIHSAWRALAAAIAVAAVSAASAAVFVPAVAAPGHVAAAGSAPKWEVGDCLAEGDVEAASIDLTSGVSCSEDHVAQIVGGATLPAGLRALSRAELFASGPKLAAFVEKTCASGPVLRNLYPKKTARALAKVIDQHDVAQWVVPAAGRFDIVLPDQASYDAGAHAVLCVFVPDASFSGSTAGDVRDAATGDPLDALRICFDRKESGSGTDLTPCTNAHDFEGLLWLQMPVGDLPESVADWPDRAWADFDDVCGQVGEIVVGAARDDLAYRANTNGDLPVVEGKRFVYCEASPAADGVRLPGGVSVAGLDGGDIEFVGA